MYDPDTLELAEELGMDPRDVASYDYYVNEVGAAQMPSWTDVDYDDLEDEILGDYMRYYFGSKFSILIHTTT